MVTARAGTAPACELDRLGLASFFHEILSTPAGKLALTNKRPLSSRNTSPGAGSAATGHWMIGDTEADIGAGPLVGLGRSLFCRGFATVNYCCEQNRIFSCLIFATYIPL